jgi:NADH-quinone oxidoreductase subunit J
MNALFFWFFSAGMIVCALAVILNRNAVASALCFTFSIVFMAGLFVLLSAFFLAAVQILVTAGAVMVLFLFIIMLLDLTAMEHMPRRKMWMGSTLLLGLGFLFVVARTLAATPGGNTTIDSLPVPGAVASASGSSTAQPSDDQDDTHQIGRLLFSTCAGQTSYVAPFEITSLLILIATIGVIVLCKQEEPRRTDPRDAITREAPPVRPAAREPAAKI